MNRETPRFSPRRTARLSALLRGALSCVLLVGCSVASPAVTAAEITTPPGSVSSGVRLERFASGLDQPVYLTTAPGDPTRLYVVEKTGRIRILKGGGVLPDAFLDLSGQVSRGSEQGLLGLAFHPQFAKNGRLFVDYTDRKGDTHVTEYRIHAGNPEKADTATEKDLFFLKQPYANHNGGDLVFGPDGRLYVGTGDGGSGGDPHKNGQNPTALLGKMLRFDVDAPQPAPEIIDIGLRNPWRYAFDAKTADLYIADVGQNEWEEVDFVAAKDLTNHNFGWNVFEGNHCFKNNKGCADRAKFTFPVAEYSHKDGCSITGGYVYRGKALPQLDGVYFYADYCTALIRSLRIRDGAAADQWSWREVLDPQSKVTQISSFGVDADNELYVLSLDGIVWKFVPAAAQQPVKKR